MSDEQDPGGRDDPVQIDAALLARVDAGDSRACRILVDAHLGRVTAFAWRMLGDAGEAEDVAQEAFLRLWRQAANWRADARVGTWLHRVVHNLCIDRLRRQRPLANTEPPDILDPSDGPFADRQRAQVARIVERALAGLSERQRAAITLVHYQEFGNIKAAAILGVSVEALESLLARGRRSLRDRLRDKKNDLIGEL